MYPKFKTEYHEMLREMIMWRFDTPVMFSGKVVDRCVPGATCSLQSR